MDFITEIDILFNKMPIISLECIKKIANKYNEKNYINKLKKYIKNHNIIKKILIICPSCGMNIGSESYYQINSIVFCDYCEKEFIVDNSYERLYFYK